MLDTEKALAHWLQKRFPLINWTRIENSVSVGLPDLHGFELGTEFWIELKVKTPLLRPAQWVWFCKRHAQGMKNQFVFCAKGSTLHVWQMPFGVVPKGGKLLIVQPPMQFNVKAESDIALIKGLFSRVNFL